MIDNIVRFCLGSILVLCGPWTSCTSAQDRPNVLIISLDDMNDWLGCYGGHPDAKTPNIDRLAQRGVVFTHAHCVSPICGPSRASVLTGMRPETTGVYHNRGTYIDYVPDAVTFPEHFRAHGYRTLAAGKVNHGLGEPDLRLWDENGPDCGVLGTPFMGDELHTVTMTPERIIHRGSLNVTLPANGGLSAIDRPNNTWDSFDWAPLDCPETDFPDRKIADWGANQLEQEQDQPFLLALGFYKPHQPFFAPRKYFELYDPQTISLPRTIAGDLHDVPAPGRELATRPWTSGTHKTVARHNAWRDAVHGYLATVSFVDSLVGRVMEALDQSPHAHNTWVVLWSDHGWSLGEKEHWGKHVPWRESVRMPLMIIPPKNATPKDFQPGTRCDARVSLLDLYPTLLDACSLPNRTAIEGQSLLPLIANPAAKWRNAVVSTIGRGTHSISTDRWRYIHYFDGSEELYDLGTDSREWFNVAYQPEHAELKRRLSAHRPIDRRLKQFIRWGRWKCVIPVEGSPMLFDYRGEFGISEQNDLAQEQPEVITRIIGFLQDRELTARHVDITAMLGEDAVRRPAEIIRRTVFSLHDSGTSKYGYRIPSLVTTSEGTLLAFCERRTGLHDHAKNDIVIRRSEDGGRSWEDQIVVAEDGDNSLNDPCAIALKDGRILLRYKRYPEGVHQRAGEHTVLAEAGYGGPRNVTIYLTESKDDGLTWSEPRDVSRQMKRKAALAVGSPGIGIQLTRGKHQGRIVFPNYESFADGKGGRTFDNAACWSDDAGKTWQLSELMGMGDLSGQGNEAQLVELANGTLLMSTRIHASETSRRRFAFSRDGGETWRDQRLADDLVTPACMSSIIRVADSMGAQNSLLLHSLPHSTTKRDNGSIFFSRDDGATWTKGIEFESDGFAYSCLSQLPNGNIGCLYERTGDRAIVFADVPLKAIVNTNH